MVTILELSNQLGDSILSWLVTQWPAINQVHPWAFFAGMVVAAVLLSQAAAYILGWIAHALTSKTKSEIDDIIIHAVRQPFAWIVFSILLYVAFAPIQLDGAWQTVVSGSLAALNIALVAWLLHRLSNAIFDIWKSVAKDTESVLDDTMLPIASKFIVVTIWIIGFLMILSAWGFEIGPFLAGLGIAGIAIGFAIKDSLANIFGGISLALDHAYKVGDKVKVGEGTLGVVHDITLRSTRIRTYDGDMVMVPNGVIANDNIYTYAQPAPKSRGQVNFGVQYGSKVEKVKEVVLKVLDGLEHVEKDPAPSVLFMRMGDSALEFRAYFWCDDYNKVFSTEREATEGIYKALNESKIGIPFPTRTIYMHNA